MAAVTILRRRLHGRARFLRSLALFVCIGAALVGSGCLSGGKKRPAGFLNLGPVAELALPKETYFSDLKILLRRDAGGLYAMSTACTYDLSPLQYSERDGKALWRSQFSESTYAADGSVVHGPAQAPLPYYKLVIAPGTVGGASDTLFVEVGIERAPSWRLPVPAAFLAAR